MEGDLESAAVAIVGRLALAFSRFEFNLGLCLRDLVGGRNVDLVTPRERERGVHTASANSGQSSASAYSKAAVGDQSFETE